jgi:hypothetical protein
MVYTLTLISPPESQGKSWEANKIVGNLGCLSHKDLRHVLRGYKKLEWDFFSNLRKIAIDNRQGKGLE